jgi:WhiB family redox-sensing transcriptional regulator
VDLMSYFVHPVSDIRQWEQDGACRQADPRLFFPPENESGPARRKRDAAAVKVCSVCPVIQECRRHAWAVREPHGVWGGLTADERDEIFRGDDATAAEPVPDQPRERP